MAVQYNKLWKRLIDMKIKKSSLTEMAGVSASTIAKLSHDEYVSLEILERICRALHCEIGDVVELRRSRPQRKILRRRQNHEAAENHILRAALRNLFCIMFFCLYADGGVYQRALCRDSRKQCRKSRIYLWACLHRIWFSFVFPAAPSL